MGYLSSAWRVAPIRSPFELGLGGVALVASLLAVFLTSPSAAPSSPESASTKVMVLQLTDLPIGFGLANGHAVSNAEASKASSVAKDYRRLGRVTGYDATYTKHNMVGLFEVESSASIYKTSDGARRSLMLSFAAVEQKGGGEFRRLSVPTRLGSDMRLYVTTRSQKGTKLDIYTVLWRDRGVYATLSGGGRSGTIDPAQVVALAAKQEARIGAAFQ